MPEGIVEFQENSMNESEAGWLIQVLPENFIEITLISFVLESSSTCL